MPAFLQRIERRVRRLPSWATPAAIVAGGVILGTSIAYVLVSSTPRVSVQGADDVRALVRPLADVMGWPELEDFAAAKAYTESRFHADAGDCDENRACGLFGMRGASADVIGFDVTPEDLHDPRVAAVTMADYAWRVGHKYGGPDVDWGAIFRGWALPSLVSDYDWSQERSQDALGRAEIALYHAGLPDSFLDRRAYPPGSRHPGRAALLKAMGLPSGGIA